MECLGLHNEPKAEVHPGHQLMGPKKEEEAEESQYTDLTDVVLEILHYHKRKNS
jgi:hypothetical protein